MKFLINCKKCGNCCLETEMLLSINDIHSIINNVRPSFQFFEEKNGYLFLLNISGHCIFFDDLKKKCKIYEFRPQGCRFYPLIYDNGKCVVDNDCTNRKNIRSIDKNITIQVMEFIELLERERKARLITR